MMGTSAMYELIKKLQFVIKLFVAAGKLTRFKLLNKNTISSKRIMVSCCEL